jgi:hypothetical protein
MRAQQRESVWHRNQEETQCKFNREFLEFKREKGLYLGTDAMGGCWISLTFWS